MRAQRLAQCTLPSSDAAVNEHVVLLDSRRVRVAARDFELDEVFVPMSAGSLFRESGLARGLERAAQRGAAAAVVYYGDADAGKDAAEFLLECGQALGAACGQVQLSAYGFYRDRRVALAAGDAVARSAGGVRELLQQTLPVHARHARRARGRAHAVFRFEAAAAALYVYLVDGLPNALRHAGRARLTTRADDLAGAADRPGLAARLLRTIRADAGAQARVHVVVHCPLAAEHAYALVDSLRFADEWAQAERALVAPSAKSAARPAASQSANLSASQDAPPSTPKSQE